MLYRDQPSFRLLSSIRVLLSLILLLTYNKCSIRNCSRKLSCLILRIWLIKTGGTQAHLHPQQQTKGFREVQEPKYPALPLPIEGQILWKINHRRGLRKASLLCRERDPEGEVRIMRGLVGKEVPRGLEILRCQIEEVSPQELDPQDLAICLQAPQHLVALVSTQGRPRLVSTT